MATEDPILILGAGHAGGRAAGWLRHLGCEEKIILIGAEEVPPYERPPLSKGLMTGAKTFADCRLHDEGFYGENAIELRLGTRVSALDLEARRVVTSNGGLAFSKVILATGATPRKLSIPGSDLPGIFTLRDLKDSQDIQKRLDPDSQLVIVGGGFIGLEVAASARKLGSEVVVLEAAQQLLGRSLPSDVARAITDIHRAAGVTLQTGAQITSFTGHDQVEAVVLADDTEIPATAVVVGIGITPNIQLAEAAGLPCENGILADSNCRAGEDIYVIGDAAAAFNEHYQRHLRLESWQNAEQQAEIAARAILGEPSPWNQVPWVWSDQYDWNLQVAGFPGAGDRVVRRGDPAKGKALYFGFDNCELVGAAALGQGLSAAKDLRVAQMLIERGARLKSESLVDEGTNLKKLLKAA